jgi:hypothetical protein
MSQTATVVLIVAIIVALLASALAFALWRRTRLLPLSDDSRGRYARSWRGIEARFIDDPGAAVQEADQVVVTMLSERGATLADPRSVPGDLVKAREAAASDRGQSGTEGRRIALVYYRRIVDHSVGSARMKKEGFRREVAS